MISVGSEVQILPGPPMRSLFQRIEADRWCLRPAKTDHTIPIFPILVFPILVFPILLIWVFCPVWGRSSAGRAPALQAGGRRFDPDRLHHGVCTQAASASSPTAFSAAKGWARSGPGEVRANPRPSDPGRCFCHLGLYRGMSRIRLDAVPGQCALGAAVLPFMLPAGRRCSL